jgi:hypothetical protein
MIIFKYKWLEKTVLLPAPTHGPSSSLPSGPIVVLSPAFCIQCVLPAEATHLFLSFPFMF